ncbi:DUF3951 domain-containing protein [Peribacillus muralis]|uniref:DUF3951 domain-containing protein n=1 Tax=Peribacillus muralis TaxID=264697 RepID=UPI00070FF0C6|nr:DUF3951 domain-containing protein [Peribacillus muralis]
MVSTLLILTIVAIIGLIGYRMIFKKKKPSNLYTPYDEVMGPKDDAKREIPAQETKHTYKYEEKSEEDKSKSPL